MQGLVWHSLDWNFRQHFNISFQLGFLFRSQIYHVRSRIKFWCSCWKNRGLVVSEVLSLFTSLWQEISQILCTKVRSCLPQLVNNYHSFVIFMFLGGRRWGFLDGFMCLVPLVELLIELGGLNPILVVAHLRLYFEVDRPIEHFLPALKNAVEQLLARALIVHKALIQFLLLFHRVLVLPETPLDRWHLGHDEWRRGQRSAVCMVVLRRLDRSGQQGTWLLVIVWVDRVLTWISLEMIWLCHIFSGDQYSILFIINKPTIIIIRKRISLSIMLNLHRYLL